MSLWQLFCYTNALTVLVSIARNWSAHATPRPISCYLFLAQRKVRADWIFEGILCHATVYDADVVESLLELAIELRAKVEREHESARSSLWGMRIPCSPDPDLDFGSIVGTSRISAPT